MAAVEVQAAPGRPAGHSHADEWAAEWMRNIQMSRYRRARIRAERSFPSPWGEQLQAERDYDQETEQLRRFVSSNPFSVEVARAVV